jgi:transaldolase / glucose-6-phosphate isomerase
MDLKKLHREYGQSVWLDYIRRDILESGEFARLVKEDGIRGVTSNPSIFEKAITESTDYGSALEGLVKERGATAPAIYEQLAVQDLQQAADILRPVYDESDRRDGYVSMEVSPYLAHDTRATIDEATRLRSKVGRDNLMIKVPGTPEGVPAIRELTSQGINVNVTLLFSRAACCQVNEAYMDGLETLAARGGDLPRVASVASMFVSRLDALVDPILEERALAASAPERAQLRSLVGKVAIANAKLAYQDWKEVCRGARWLALAARGARAQRLLWASTGTKDPRFSDVLYAESLIGPDTVDTIPPATLDALRNHGKAQSRLEENIDDARQVLATLARSGISIDELTARLLDDGVTKFSTAFATLLGSIEKRLPARSAPRASATI